MTVVLKRHESNLVALHGHRLLVVGQQICRRTPDLAQSDIEGAITLAEVLSRIARTTRNAPRPATHRTG